LLNYLIRIISQFFSLLILLTQSNKKYDEKDSY